MSLSDHFYLTSILIDAIAKLLLLPIRNMTNLTITGPTVNKHMAKSGLIKFCDDLFRPLYCTSGAAEASSFSSM